MNYRYRANLILGGVFLLFGLSALLRTYYREVFAYKLMFSVLEAALVGGIADWFAVSALFRKPLGISYHTALIPRNRGKLIEAVVQLVEEDLLSPEVIQAKMVEADIIRPLTTWVDRNRGPEHFAQLVSTLLGDYLLSLDPAELSAKLDGLVRQELGKLNLPQALIRLGRWASTGGEDDKTLNVILGRMIALARSPAARRKIQQLVKKKETEKTKGKFFMSLLADLLEATNSLNLEEASAALHSELVKRLTELKEPGHPLRLKIKQMLREGVVQLENDLNWQNSLAAWKQDVLADVPLEEIMTGLIQAVMDKVASGAPLTSWLEEQLQKYWDQFKLNRALQDWLERYLKEALVRLLQSEHYLIGSAVRETLNSLSDVELNGFIEGKAGNDLQWIRVNGSIVGGAIGLLLFLLLNFVYNPLFQVLAQHGGR